MKQMDPEDRTTRHRPRSRSGRRSVRAAAVGVVLLALAALTTLPAPAAPAGAAGDPSGSTGPTGASGAAPVVDERIPCLDARLRPDLDCPALEVEVALSADADGLSVVVGNTGEAAWEGGPVAVELPLPAAEVDEPTGTLDEAVGGGGAEWVTRGGTVVGRCVFEPVTSLAPGDDLTCRLPRFGLADGEHTLWLTGFVGGLPPVGGPLADDAPAVGVGPVATSRSVRFQLDGDDVTVLAGPAAEGTDPAADPVAGDGDGGGAPWTVVVPSVLVAVALGAFGWWRWGRRSTNADNADKTAKSSTGAVMDEGAERH